MRPLPTTVDEGGTPEASPEVGTAQQTMHPNLDPTSSPGDSIPIMQSRDFAIESPSFSRFRPSIKPLLFFAVLPNLFFIILGQFIFMLRPLVNVDYLLVGILGMFIPSWAGILAFAAVFTNGILLDLGPVFHFTITDVVYSLPDLVHLSAGFLLPRLSLVLFTIGLLAWLSIRYGCEVKSRRTAVVALVATGFVFAVLDILNGSAFVTYRPVNTVRVNFAYSGIRKTQMAFADAMSDEIKIAQLPPERSAVGQVFRKIGQDPAAPKTTNVVLVLVESMGYLKDRQARELLEQPLFDPALAKRYRVHRGSVPFRGKTINGEFRELCSLDLAYADKPLPRLKLADGGDSRLTRCLPSSLKPKGFETVALHGFTNQFYGRYRWYPKLGFDRMIFAEDMHKLGINNQCNPGFTGICDQAVADLLHKELQTPGTKPRKFIHWMTLSSHIPTDENTAASSVYDCSKNATTASDAELCTHTRTVSRVFSQIARIARDKNVSDTMFIIVGDHAPPFMTNARRAAYEERLVPYIALEPVSRDE